MEAAQAAQAALYAEAGRLEGARSRSSTEAVAAALQVCVRRVVREAGAALLALTSFYFEHLRNDSRSVAELVAALYWNVRLLATRYGPGQKLQLFSGRQSVKERMTVPLKGTVWNSGAGFCEAAAGSGPRSHSISLSQAGAIPAVAH